MVYLYYPGCSLKGSGRPYEESMLAVFSRLGVEMPELPEWNCCGATAYMAVDETKAFALAARNLALAELRNGSTEVHMVAPCSACYLAHLKVQSYMKRYPEVGRIVEEALKEAGLDYRGHVRVRHPLDVLVNDVGLERIEKAVVKPLDGLKVACYYGCQVVRPFSTFDDQRNPMSMDRLLKAAGAEVIDWSLKERCCGGTLTGTIEEAGLRLSFILLKEARKRGAEMVVTACPLCQFNLECYQGRMASQFREEVDVPVAYFTQLLGAAMGIADKDLGIQRMMMQLPAKAHA
jgi:heterodisulfide reductase subunit B2